MNGRHRSCSGTPKRNAVVVAVKASKEIPRAALTWALTNVVRPGDSVRLLVVIPTHSTSSAKMILSKRLWGFTNFHSDCADGYLRFMTGTKFEQKEYIAELCNRTMCQLHDIYDPDKVTVKLKVMNESKDGAVASEAKRVQTNWVILERQMKREAQHCMEQLDCNVIVVKNSEPKVLRWNLMEPKRTETEMLPSSKSSRKQAANTFNILDIMKVPNVTPSSSPDRSPDRTSSISSLDFLASPTFLSDINLEPKVKQMLALPFGGYDFGESDTDSDSEIRSTLASSLCLSSPDEGSRSLGERLKRSGSKGLAKDINLNLSKNVRDMMSLNENASSHSPPLCSICQNKTPCFGKPPRLFSYAELEEATGGFLEGNFLAEGGYGSVHRGVLRDGLVIAVKQHKLASAQGDREFCSEVQVLSCAQHRNVVMLIGYCAEDSRRLLVYEYICNGSLDSHLYGRNQTPLDWAARQKIAVGAARGLRYLHEECRVGCIVHRDLRPNNILLTHDFEPLVGDFGLARFQPDGETGVETRVIGTFGYLAPEYAQSGQVSEKADVYAFGVVLLELVTGRKAVDINRPKGEQCLTEWARPLIKENTVAKLIDPCLMHFYSEKEVDAMLHCASLCLQRDASSRPRMSQVLRMLEGDALTR